VYKDSAGFYSHLSVEGHKGRAQDAGYSRYSEAATLDAVRGRIDTETSLKTALTMTVARALIFAWQVAYYLLRRKKNSASRPVLGSGASAQSLSARLSLFWFRLAQLATERRALADSIADLVPNLQRARGLAAETDSSRPLRLVVGDRRTEFILGLLLALHAIPRMQLERAEPGAQIERIIAETGDRGNPQRLILARGLYYCSYPPIASLYLARAFTVL
jgi:hypothetical protein